MIVPPTNTVNEAEWARLAPAGVSLHAMRMALHPDVDTDEGAARMMQDLAVATAVLAQAPIDVVAYCCTAGSLLLPIDRVADAMRSVAGVPCVATAPALVHACRTLGVERVALATPYDDRLNAHEAEFLTACGLKVVSVAGLGIGANGPHEYARIAALPLPQVMQHVLASDAPDAQAMIVSCTDLATLPVIEELEKALGKPVITSNQATFWAALRAAGSSLSVPGAGRLLTTR